MAKDMYIGVNNVAQKVKKAYVGVNGVAKEVKNIYVGVNGVARNVYSSSNIPAPGDMTEDQFISLLNAGVYDSSYIGSIVTLSNTAYYNNGTWIIADVNHDSTNTGQTNCYDLISVDCINPVAYGSSNNQWRSSNVRTWLNDTFYNGLSSDIKSHIMNIKYKSNGTWYNDDKVIIPSCTELNYSDATADIEGIAYPIFTDNASRIKYQFGTTDAYYWWTRSRRTTGDTVVWYVLADGSFGRSFYNSIAGSVVPTLRIS